MVMGCNESREKESREKESREKESREKERPPINLTFAVATPLPLHLYQEYVYPIRKSPTLSTGSLSPTSSASLSPTSRASPTSFSPTAKASPTAKGVTTSKASPTTKSAATSHYNKLRAIAHYKIPTFKDFPSHVQQEIFHHIEKELENLK